MNPEMMSDYLKIKDVIRNIFLKIYIHYIFSSLSNHNLDKHHLETVWVRDYANSWGYKTEQDDLSYSQRIYSCRFTNMLFSVRVPHNSCPFSSTPLDFTLLSVT